MNWIKQRWFLLVLNTFCALLLWGQSPERPKKEIPLITDVVASITKAQGWVLQNNGEWLDAQNMIPFQNYAQNKRKSGKYGLGQDNFDRINIRSITVDNTVYSILVIYSQGGNYEFPVLEDKWNQYNILTYYVFKEVKWNQMFPDSTVFNQPYAVNLDVICTDELIDYSEESYLFEIENHIRQAIYQQESNNTNLIFAAYPVKIKEDKYFRFKFYETINKQEIYVKYLLEYNWEKLFRTYYYETDYKTFETFAQKIGVIDPEKIHKPNYYLHFIHKGIEKFEDEEYRTALQLFIKAAMVNPPDSAMISINLWKGKSKLNLRTFNEALEDFNQAIGITPATMTENRDWILAHYERGKTYNALHDYLNACEDWNFSLQNGVAEAYEKIKKNCGKMSGDMPTVNIEKSDKYFQKGIKKFDDGKNLKALHFFEQSWENNQLSQDFRLPYYIGLCRFQLGDYVRCIDEFEQAVALEPDKYAPVYSSWTQSLVMLGNAWQKLNFDDIACENWYKATKLSNAEAFELFNTYCDNYQVKENEIELAHETTIEAILLEYDKGNFKETATLTIHSENINSDSTLIKLFSYRGSAKNKTGDYAGAIADFTQIIDKPTDKSTPYYTIWVNAHFNRGISKYASGDLNGACTDWKKALDLGLSNPDALETIGTYCNQ